MLPEEGTALVIGLGNPNMTPDAIGPLTLESLLVTRHLTQALPESFGGFRQVAALGPGVLGSTGLESQETVRALVETVKPAFVLAVDALASRSLQRLCSTVQLTDAGIAPGSGVGNHRAALCAETLGVPVIGIGVPTVVEAATLALDLLEESGGDEAGAQALREKGRSLMVTPQDIDAAVRDMARALGYGLNWALQDLDLDAITELLS